MPKYKYTIEFFKKFAEEKQGKCLSDEYVNGNTKLSWQCKDGHIWSAQPRKMIEGSWCPECYRNNCHKYTCDNEFFSRDTEESFYVAGFLAADGWKTRKSGGSYKLGLQLAKKDFNHLVNVRDTMGSDAKLFYSEGVSPTTGNKTYAYSFTINSKQIYNDLERFGVVPNKTYIYDMPEWLKAHSLVRHFIRGYVDGDGCFCVAKNKDCHNPHVLFSMKGTAPFLISVNDILTREKIVDRKHIIIPREGKKYKAFDNLQYGGNGICSRIYDYLYKDNTICLNRKNDIVKNAKEWAVYGTDKRKQRKRTALPITKETLLEKAAELKSQRKIANHFNCSAANISWHINYYNIRAEMDKAIGKIAKEEIVRLYNLLGTKAAVAKHVGLTKARVSQIIKEASSANNQNTI